MSGLYEDDIVTWAERQAELLRRMAAGERINDQVDWENVIEEVESMGRSEVETVMSLLINVMDHKLRLIGWPDHAAANHWRHEIRPWLARIAKRHGASMHIEAEMAALFRIARLDIDAHMLDAGPSPVALPAACPWTLDELLAAGEAALHYRYRRRAGLLPSSGSSPSPRLRPLRSEPRWSRAANCRPWSS